MIPDSNLKKIKNLEKTVATIRDQLIFTPPTNDLSMVFGNLGQRNAAHGVLTGTEAIQPITHLLTDVTDAGVSTGVFDRINLLSSNVMIDRSGFSALTLKWIQKTANNGQRIAALTVKSGKTLDVVSGGNIAVGATISMTDQTLLYLVWSDDISAYRVLSSSSGGGGSGANTSLSNLIATSINQSLVPNASASLNLGSTTFYWLAVFLDSIRFNGSGSATQIQTNGLGTVMNFRLDGFIHMNLSKSSTTGVLEVASAQTSYYKTVSNLATPTANQLVGQYAFDAFDSSITRKTFAHIDARTRVVTGGGTGQLDFYVIVAGTDTRIITATDTGTTIINNFTTSGLITTLGSGTINIGDDPADSINFFGRVSTTITPITNDIYDLGSSSLAFQTLNIKDIRFRNNGLVVSNLTMITKTSGNDMAFNVVAATDFYEFNFGGTAKWTLTQTSQTGPNLILTNTLTINDSSTNPSSNGQLSRNGSDLKVFSGGALKDFTQMPQLNGTNTWTVGNVFNNGLSIRAANYLIFNQNDTSDTYIRQSTGVGVTPKKIDISVFADIVFQGVGETSSLLSRGMFKAMQKAGDITTAELPSGYACMVKNTSSGLAYLAYNDGGTIKKAFVA